MHTTGYHQRLIPMHFRITTTAIHINLDSSLYNDNHALMMKSQVSSKQYTIEMLDLGIWQHWVHWLNLNLKYQQYFDSLHQVHTTKRNGVHYEYKHKYTLSSQWSKSAKSKWNRLVHKWIRASYNWEVQIWTDCKSMHCLIKYALLFVVRSVSLLEPLLATSMYTISCMFSVSVWIKCCDMKEKQLRIPKLC